MAIIIGTNGDDDLIGTGNADAISGRDGDDTLSGRGGSDVLAGGDGDDVLDGGSGIDALFGGAGADILRGGSGGDSYTLDDIFTPPSGDRFYDAVEEEAGAGIDTVFVTPRNVAPGRDGYTLPDNVEQGVIAQAGVFDLTGNGLDNSLIGNNDANTLQGRAGDDNLLGRDGNDVLHGGTGDDNLVGGLGQDRLSGSDGDDTFVFVTIGESGVGGAARDRITDFSVGSDRIVLATIDADTTMGGDQAFSFIGETAFSHTAGELRQFQTAANTIVEADVNGDGTADFQIELKGLITLSPGDFVL